MKTRIILILMLCLPLTAISQDPTYQLILKNDSLVSSTIYEFDIYLVRTGTTVFQLASVQPIMRFNPAISSGTMTFTIQASSSELNSSQQPQSMSITGDTLLIAPRTVPGVGNGTIIPPAPGVRVGRFRLTSSVPFSDRTANIIWKNSVNPFTKVNAYTVADLNAVITDSTGHLNQLANRTLSPLVIASATPLPAATAGTVYHDTLRATGGTRPYSWSVISGALPGGLSLSSTGAISGTPTLSGSSTFTAQVADSNLTTISGSFSITVNSGTLDRFLVEAQTGGSIITQIAGMPFNIKITAKDAYDNTITNFTGTADITSNGTISSGGGTTPAFTGSILASLSITITSSGSAVSITATRSGGIETGVSNLFIVNPAAAARLAIQTQPSAGAVAGSAFAAQPVIRIEDNFGNLIDSDNATVVTASRSTGTALLQGTLNASAAGGVAAFTNLSYNVAENITILFSAGGLTSVTSATTTVSHAPASKVSVETSPTGEGTIVPVQTISSGTAVTAYAVTRDPYNNFIGNVAAIWTLLNPTGSVSTDDLIPNIDSKSATFTGRLVGTTRIKAVSGVLDSIPSGIITVTPGSATQLAFSQGPAGDTAGVVLAPAITVQLKDVAGNNVPAAGVLITISLSSGNGTLSGTKSRSTDVNGLATFNDLSIDKSGSKVLTAISGALTSAISSSFPISPAAPTQIIFVQQPTNTIAGSIISPAVTLQLVDPFANNVPLAGVTITVTIANGSDTLRGTKSQLTDASGLAAFSDLDIHLAGTKSLTASGGTYISATSNSFMISASSAVRALVETAADGSGSPVATQSIISGNSISAYAVSRDTFNNFTGYINATWTLNDITGGVVAGDLVPFDINRAAVFNAHAAGTATIKAASGGLTPYPSGTITVIAGSVKKLVFTQQPSGSIAGIIIAPAVTVQLEDSLNNNVPAAGVQITVSLTTGNGTLSGTLQQLTDATGLATFNNLKIDKTGSKILTASSGSLTAATSNLFAISAASPAKIVFTQQPPATDTASRFLTPAITIYIQDSLNNDVPISGDTIRMSLSSGTGTLSGTVIKLTDAAGGATFDNLSIDKSGTKQLTATCGIYPSVTSNFFSINASAPYKVVVETNFGGSGTTVPPQVLQSGDAITVYGIIRDSYDNFIANDTTLVWDLQSTTDGIKQTDLVHISNCNCATFHARLVGTAQIRAQKAGLISVNSGTLTVIPGSASKLFFSGQPTNGIAGGIISPPVKLQLEDLAGNNVSSLGNLVSMSLAGGTPGTLTGTTQKPTDANGTATFDNLSVDTPGKKVLYSYDGVHTPAYSDTFTLGTYTITATAGLHGTLTPSGSIAATYNSSQSFSVKADTGYHIFDVVVDAVSQGAISGYTFNNITANHSITASFAIDTLIITATAGVNGAISPSGSVKVTYGSNQTFNFTPEPGHHVLNFTADGVTYPAQPSYTFTNVKIPHSISVIFVPDSLTITSSAGSFGTISPSGLVKIGYGTNQTFTITPSTGYHVFDLLVDGSTAGRVISYVFNNVIIDHTISASFAIDTFTVAATAGLHGTISPSGAIRLTYGSSRIFTITPDTGYHISDVVLDGSSVGAVSSYPLNNVTSNHSIVASFAINTYTITPTHGPNGTIVPSIPTQVNYGASLTFSIRPSTGYHVDSVKADNIYVGSDTTYTFTNVTTNHTITATFAPNILTVTFQTDPANLWYVVDGVRYKTLKTFIWTAAQSHTISADTIQNGTTDTRYVWSSWTNAAKMSDTVTPLVNTIYTANFTTQYYLKMASNGGGSVSPPDGWFNKGQVVTINGIPDVNYSFNTWSGFPTGTGSGSYSGGNNPATITMNGPITETANFKLNPISITVQTSPSGRSFSYDGITYTLKQTFIEVNPGTQHYLNLNVTQPGGAGYQYIWKYWSDSGTANHPIQPMTDTTYTANFIKQFTLTMTAGSNGSVTPGSGWRDSGSVVSIKATPDAGYIFKGWNGTGAGSFTGLLDSATITMGGAITESAIFAIDTMTITASAGAHGTISPSGNLRIVYGTSQTFSITPDSLYHISDVVVDGTSIGARTSYTFTNVVTNHAIIASFTITGHTITATAGTNGIISPSGPINVEYGLDQAFSIRPNTGYHVDTLFVDGLPVDSDTIYTFRNVTVNHTISAKFAINQLVILATATAHGTISPSGSVNVNYGSSKSFTFAPDTGYHIDTVLVDGVYRGAVTDFTFTNVIINHTISVTFAINRFTITSSAGNHGTINPSGVSTVNYNDSLAFAILPDTGYHTALVLVDGLSAGSPPSYVFMNIRANHTISASFAINAFTIIASAGPNGTMTPNGTINLTYGADQLFSIKPDANYHIDSVIVDGTFIGADTSYTFNNVTGNHTIHAAFSINILAVTIKTNPDSLSVLVDNIPYRGTHQFLWSYGSIHNLAAIDTQNTVIDTRYLFQGWSDGASKRHNIILVGDSAFTATFKPQYYLTMNSDAEGNVTPSSGWQDSSKVVLIRAIPNPGFRFLKWQGTVSYPDTNNPANIVMNSPITEKATFTRYPARVTIQSNPGGLSIIADDTIYTSPKTFSWITGSIHSVAIADTQPGAGGTRYVWTTWSDSGSRSHTITPLSDTTFIAIFTTQHFITMIANSGGTVTPSSGWYNKNQTVTITAIPYASYNFTGWSGTGSGSYNGPSVSAPVTMLGPITETANFTRKPVQITIDSNPAGRIFSYNGSNYTAKQTRTIDPGTQQYLGVPSPQPDTLPDRQFVWASWSDSGAQAHSVFPTTDSAFIANFELQNALTVNALPIDGGTTNPGGKVYFDDGDTVSVRAIPNTGYVFTHWSGAITGTQNPGKFILSSPQTVTANFGHSVQVLFTSIPSGRKVVVDDSVYTTPKTIQWLRGSTHMISTIPVQSDTAGIRHRWTGWSDNGDTTHLIVPWADTTYSAAFSTEYYLTMNPSAGGIVSPPSGWVQEGRSLPISAIANTDYQFYRWTGTGSGSYTGSDNPGAINMYSPIHQDAIFSRILQPPSLTGIADGAVNVPTSPTLIWYSYPGATSYGIQVSTDSTFTETARMIIQRTGLTDTSIQIPTLANLKNYYWHVNARAGIDIAPYSQTRKFTTITAIISVMSPGMTWATGYNYQVNWNSTNLSGSVNLRLSADSGRSYRLIKTDLANSGSEIITIPDSVVLRAADSCRIRVESYLNNELFGLTDAFSIVPGKLPAMIRLSTSIPFSSKPVASTEYRLFGMPGIVDTIKAGSYQPGAQRTDWRMFADNGSVENFLIEMSANSVLTTGEGYWLLKKGNLDIPIFDMVTPQLNSDATYSIPVHSGWNIIANPYDKSLTWQLIIDVNNLQPASQLYAYTGSFIPSENMEPFKGYYFFNSSNLTRLKLPYPFGRINVLRFILPVSWKLQLTFESDINRDPDNYIGIAQGPKPGIESVNNHKPPLFLDQGFLYFPRPEWDEKYSRFSTDFRSELGDGQVWNFEISNPGKSAGTIQFDGIDKIPGEYRVVLINLLNNIPYDLRISGRYSYQTVSPTMQFKLMVGNSEFVDNQISRLIPRTIELVQNFPNPFNNSTSISIKLPRESNIKLDIYNTLGQQVKVITDNRLSAGIYTYSWDGNDAAGFSVATGVYIYRLIEDGNLVQTKKMILIK